MLSWFLCANQYYHLFVKWHTFCHGCFVNVTFRVSASCRLPPLRTMRWGETISNDYGPSPLPQPPQAAAADLCPKATGAGVGRPVCTMLQTIQGLLRPPSLPAACVPHPHSSMPGLFLQLLQRRLQWHHNVDQLKSNSKTRGSQITMDGRAW